MKLPGLDAVYWVANTATLKDGDTIARIYATGFAAVIAAFPIAAAIELTCSLCDSAAHELLFAYPVAVGLVIALVDRRRTLIAEDFRGCGLRFRDRLNWTVYTALACIAIFATSGRWPAVSIALFACYLAFPVSWMFRRAKQ